MSTRSRCTTYRGYAVHRCLPYSKPFFRCLASRSHWLNSQMPQVFSPSCSRMCRLPVSTRRAATLPPLVRPPTKASAPISGERTSTSDSSCPLPETSVAGSPACRISSCATVRQIVPPCDGVLAITALPASSCTSSACTSTDMG